MGWEQLPLASLIAQLPEPWAVADVGDVTVPGSARYDGARAELRVAGADIWATADAFCFLHQPLRGDGSVTARVVRLDRSDDWAKAGVMIRGSLDPGAPYAFCFLTPRNGANFQYRAAAGAGAAESDPRRVPAAPPLVVTVSRAGDRFGAFARGAEGDWVAFGEVTIAMPAEALVGLAVTSHAYKIATVGAFDGVAIYQR